MEKLLILLIHLSIVFGRNVVGCINSPYITYRKLSKDSTDIRQTLFFSILIVIYFSFASFLRLGLSSPFLLTLNLNILLFSGFIGFLGMILLIFILGLLFKRQGSLRSVYTLWSFSLLPTLTWFFFTSVMYVLLPPPRTPSFLGKIYSVFFIAFSLSLFIWKIILYYLTLRFSLRLDLFRAGAISAIIAPVIVVYSLIMYKLGVFRIPFI